MVEGGFRRCFDFHGLRGRVGGGDGGGFGCLCGTGDGIAGRVYESDFVHGIFRLGMRELHMFCFCIWRECNDLLVTMTRREGLTLSYHHAALLESQGAGVGYHGEHCTSLGITGS